MTIPASPAGVFRPQDDIVFTGSVDFQTNPTSGTTAAVVNTTAIQTLTNKILESPRLNTPTTTAHIGLMAITGQTVVEYGDGFLHQTLITFSSFPLTLSSSAQGAGQLLYQFPATGAITILGATGNVSETTTSILANTLNASATYNWGIGTAIQANGTLVTTEQNIIQSTNGTASATINVAAATSSTYRTGAPANFGGLTAAYFNVGVASAGSIDADATTLWDGYFYLTWLYSGNIA